MESSWATLGIAAFLFFLSLLFAARFFRTRRARVPRNAAVSLLVVAGSGGHTTEILRLLSSLSQTYSPRHYVLADSDKMSEEKIRSFEQQRAETSNSLFTLHRIPRSREVRQLWSSSVLTTLRSMFYSLPLTFRLKPDLLLSGTQLYLCCITLVSRTAALHPHLLKKPLSDESGNKVNGVIWQGGKNISLW
ncbi:UDP-N-acetylglucosamine transferase subunit ALG14 homolog isoform X2 [Zootoca vivipara]|uniref:UDP-N-acetylglucosamine transferase subunit ALG14 homolog isoform X2 n=1 Tax=Zootoca vivipara TaxID=8524 RepID=UPI001592AC94|nr:UDP-N-acetylglucosamine transferase subunit ALG14 homolog isoform X2 [Zootoca vivipara]